MRRSSTLPGTLLFLFFAGLLAGAVHVSADEADRADERREMVREQIEERGVKEKTVLRAMRNAPRHLFVPDRFRKVAYADRPLPIGYGQTISQPYIVAAMTEELDLEAGDKVLEVGTGSGYQAAVLAEITDEVYSIEIIGKLAKRAREDLGDAGYEEVEVRHGDGFFGWEEHAPFDAIIVTAAPNSLPPPLLQQLKPGGRMVIPVGSSFGPQRLLLVRKDKDGATSTKSLMPVRFVPFTREKR
ncbi:MAG: protein-L-isoaspartate(D-aspartate) O-methyltransferase [Verrucomicrobia bacterium]|jgi:protein-L-isoaspartate(D-aspartate) O-methyltransferase|nr:protein-L-isoaspartate(D-aspartate) O-methyltransferase [Verrucomicrobiota bacterium]